MRSESQAAAVRAQPWCMRHALQMSYQGTTEMQFYSSAKNNWTGCKTNGRSHTGHLPHLLLLLFSSKQKCSWKQPQGGEAPHAGQLCQHALQVVASKLCLWRRKIDRRLPHTVSTVQITMSKGNVQDYGHSCDFGYSKEVLFSFLAYKWCLKPFLITKGFKQRPIMNMHVYLKSMCNSPGDEQLCKWE